MVCVRFLSSVGACCFLFGGFVCGCMMLYVVIIWGLFRGVFLGMLCFLLALLCAFVWG